MIFFYFLQYFSEKVQYTIYVVFDEEFKTKVPTVPH